MPLKLKILAVLLLPILGLWMGAAIFHFSLRWTMFKCNMALCVWVCLCRITVMERVWHVTQQHTTKYITFTQISNSLHHCNTCTRNCKTPKISQYDSLCSRYSHIVAFTSTLLLYSLLLQSYTLAHIFTHMMRCDAMPAI